MDLIIEDEVLVKVKVPGKVSQGCNINILKQDELMSYKRFTS